jgi:PhzF family phenazine biosynthesis protein
VPQIVNVGPRWVVAEMADWEALHALTPDYAALAAYDRAHGVTGQTLYGTRGDADGTILTRSFAAGDGIYEDPVCGSGNGAVAAYRLAHGALHDGDHHRAVQGLSLGRRGAVDIRIRDGRVQVGGQCCTVIAGNLIL